MPHGGLTYLITESRAVGPWGHGVEDREVLNVTGPSEFPASMSLLFLLLGPLGPTPGVRASAVPQLLFAVFVSILGSSLKCK